MSVNMSTIANAIKATELLGSVAPTVAAAFALGYMEGMKGAAPRADVSQPSHVAPREFKLLGNSSEPVGASDPVPEDAKAFIDQFEAVFNFTGHGSKQQIADVPLAESLVAKVVAEIDSKFGSGNWLAAYGGDPYNAAKPDIAVLVAKMASLGVPILAVQCDKYAAYMVTADGAIADEESYGHLQTGAAYVYCTEEDSAGQILFGGYAEDGKTVVGSTRHIMKLCGNKIKGQYAFGGGQIAAQEMEIAISKEMSCTYIPLKAKTPPTADVYEAAGFAAPKTTDESALFGVLHQWACSKEDQWVKDTSAGDRAEVWRVP